MVDKFHAISKLLPYGKKKPFTNILHPILIVLLLQKWMINWLTYFKAGIKWAKKNFYKYSPATWNLYIFL